MFRQRARKPAWYQGQFLFLANNLYTKQMILRSIFLTTLLLVFSLGLANAQKVDHRPGYIIVQAKPDVPIQTILNRHSRAAELTVDRVLSNRLSIYLLKFDFAIVHEGHMLRDLKNDPGIEVAQFDHLTTLRKSPDDPRYINQWQWNNTGLGGGIAGSDIGAERAWELTTGGVTANGDTIVVAIIDDGLDVDHEDIAANVWINYKEIPDNGIDDDLNGFVDDYYGWNADDNNSFVFNNRHGLQVAGMVGATGNNGTGVTGINWNVKLMTIVGGAPESVAIASYDYALEQRILYNSTNGEKGAFVVATNSSWGIDFGQPSESPLWCSFYDLLGVHGILSAGATSNSAYDVDQGGDLPTACPSDFLLSVTAVDNSDRRNFSAWGKKHVDFAAPGDNVLTTRRDNQYGTTSGTSFASPIAAGLVALLYSVPCQGLADLARDYPNSAAILVRNMIFEGIRPVPSLDNTIRFGGVLNAGNSAELLAKLCSECPTPFNIGAVIKSDSEVDLFWIMMSEADSISIRIRAVGSDEWDTLGIVSNPYSLTGLTGCTSYEVSFASFCADTTAGYGENFEFKTDGCCELPVSIDATADKSSINITWDDVLAAESYLVQWRPEGNVNWEDLTTEEAGIVISELDSCTYYEIRLQTNCAVGATEFSEISTIRTFGCGACYDLAYCTSNGENAESDYIDNLRIGPILNNSGYNEGYALFDNGYDFIKGDSYSYSLKPGFGLGGSFNEHFRIWIDYNQDGLFDVSEMVADGISMLGNSVEGTFAIPESVNSGGTRMRVSMTFSNPFFPIPPESCGLIDFGEVEDYCIRIINPPIECPLVDTVWFENVTFVNAQMKWSGADGALAYAYRFREVGTTQYSEFATQDTFALLENLDQCKSYEVQVLTVCATDTAGYQMNYILKTDCNTSVQEVPGWLAGIEIYPNPTHDVLQVRIRTLEAGDYQFAVYNMNGIVLATNKIHLDAHDEGVWVYDESSNLAPGMYIVSISHAGYTESRKFIKI